MRDVSVIIVNLNTRGLLEDCLESVFADVGSLDVEVIVVDNASTDGSVEMVRTRFPRVRLKINSRNEGYAKPNNDGMKIAEGRYVFLLNSDTVLKSGSMRALVNFLDLHDDAGACGPMLVYPDGRIQFSVKGFPTIWTHLCDMLFLDKLFPHSTLFGKGEMAYFRYDKTAVVDHVMAAAFLVRRGVLEPVGMFDERFSIYYNDMDWCYRMRKHGCKLYYVHDAQVVHHHGMTVGQVNKELAYFAEMYDNVMLFYLKHYGRWSVVLYRVFLALGFVFRATGWTIFRMFRSNDYSRHMFRYSWKTLAIGLQFWKAPSYSTLK